MGWRWLCAGLVFVAVSTVAAAGMGELSGRLHSLHAVLAFLLGTVAAGVTGFHASASRQKITLADGILFAVFALAALRAFLWVVYTQGNEIKVLSPHNLGDMSLHLNLIRRWAAGGAFWPQNPFLAGAAFPYHAGMDLWNALLAFAGVPVMEGLRWVGLLGSAAAAAALWRWGRGFALAAFLFAGGFAVSAVGEGTEWKNLFLTMFVTQRGLLYSIPAGLVLMSVWRTQLRGEGDGPRLPVLAQVALYASMPLFNAPAFLFLSVLLAIFFAIAWKMGRGRPFFAVGVVSVIPAVWLTALVTGNFAAPSGLRFLPGWMQGEEGWRFWIHNFGVLLPLIVLLGVVILRRGGAVASAWIFYITGVGTLIFCFFFALAPWAWDNTKLMIWGYLALVPILWEFMIGRWTFSWRAVTCVLLFGCGAASLILGLDARHGYLLADRAEVDEVQAALRSVSPNARIACFPVYNHPVLLLGHPVVMGHDGHLFSQGLDYSLVQRDLEELMSGGAAWREAARRLQTRYVLWGPREEERWPRNVVPWADCAPVMARSEKLGVLYDLTPCLLQD